MDDRIIEFLILAGASALGASITAYIAVMVSVSRTRGLIDQITSVLDGLNTRIMRIESFLMRNIT